VHKNSPTRCQIMYARGRCRVNTRIGCLAGHGGELGDGGFAVDTQRRVNLSYSDRGKISRPLMLLS